MKAQIPCAITPVQLRAARALLDWSRAQCGKFAGISAETVKNIEQGKFTPSASTVEKILHVFSEHGVEFFTQHGVSLKQQPTASEAANVYANENEKSASAGAQA